MTASPALVVAVDGRRGEAHLAGHGRDAQRPAHATVRDGAHRGTGTDQIAADLAAQPGGTHPGTPLLNRDSLSHGQHAARQGAKGKRITRGPWRWDAYSLSIPPRPLLPSRVWSGSGVHVNGRSQDGAVPGVAAGPAAPTVACSPAMRRLETGWPGWSGSWRRCWWRWSRCSPRWRRSTTAPCRPHRTPGPAVARDPRLPRRSRPPAARAGRRRVAGLARRDLPIVAYNERYAFLVGYPDPPAGWVAVPAGTAARRPWAPVPDAPSPAARTTGSRCRIPAPGRRRSRCASGIAGRPA